MKILAIVFACLISALSFAQAAPRRALSYTVVYCTYKNGNSTGYVDSTASTPGLQTYPSCSSALQSVDTLKLLHVNAVRINNAMALAYTFGQTFKTVHHHTLKTTQHV